MSTLLSTREQQLLALIALQHIDGLGPIGLARLLRSFNSLQALFDAQREPAFATLLQGQRLCGLRRFLRAPQQSVEWQIASHTLEWLQLNNGVALAKHDPRFPALLRELPDWDFIDFLILIIGSVCVYGAAELALPVSEQEAQA